ncbi:hypothetical protein [Hymenobacter sp. YC55]|uniref:hypothetical protein n=1 Tax=Hymenobacter sp. YC55 TaxID=3034019 RepID=UPI0023F7AED7|nr:hypothetical protein [Hymenobacter sp. YC55]MDF7811582.1 hypothetical protein [Hymenobacter sp. YC55]
MSLLTGFVANAQSTAATGPGPIDILGWLAGFVAVAVLLMGVISGISLAEAAAVSIQTEETTPPTEAQAPQAAAAITPEPQVSTPAPAALTAAPVLTTEPVAA